MACCAAGAGVVAACDCVWSWSKIGEDFKKIRHPSRRLGVVNLCENTASSASGLLYWVREKNSPIRTLHNVGSVSFVIDKVHNIRWCGAFVRRVLLLDSACVVLQPANLGVAAVCRGHGFLMADDARRGKHILVVFDLNGTLCHRRRDQCVVRPLLCDALDTICDRCAAQGVDVSFAVWSSATRRNVDACVLQLGVPRDTWLFVWNREHCALGEDVTRPYLARKHIERAWRSMQDAHGVVFDHTFAVDDSPSKWSGGNGGFPCPMVLLHCDTFRPDRLAPVDRELMRIAHRICEHVEEMLT